MGGEIAGEGGGGIGFCVGEVTALPAQRMQSKEKRGGLRERRMQQDDAHCHQQHTCAAQHCLFLRRCAAQH